MTDFTAGAATVPRLAIAPGSPAEALVHIAASLVLIAICIACFVVATPLGLAASFVLTLALVVARPAIAPVLIVAAFMFQNVLLATFTPLVPNDAAFDTLRGTNFVVLMTAYGAFLLATVQHWRSLPQAVRPWLLGCGALLVIICVYLGLGAVRGDPRDAIVYFRNTVTPIACFHVALVSAVRYRIEIGRALAWMGGAAVLYGYGELLFRLDFLALFNGDLYIQRAMVRQIESGYWEKTLQETGFVLRGLGDVMTTSFFNLPLFGDILPAVWRLAGPNFHPISFAYVMSIISVLLVFRGRVLLPLLAFPLLIVIGSKGAMALLVIAVLARLGMRYAGPRLTTVLVALTAFAWIGAATVFGLKSGDYHVLGMLAGFRDFIGNPLGQGLGLGGNLSSSSLTLDWNLAQASGATSIPVESAIGVMLYQMGIGALCFFALLGAVALRARALLVRTGNQDFLFVFVATTVIGANALLQEEAFYSPLALGLCLLIAGVVFGSRWRDPAVAV